MAPFSNNPIVRIFRHSEQGSKKLSVMLALSSSRFNDVRTQSSGRFSNICVVNPPPPLFEEVVGGPRKKPRK